MDSQLDTFEADLLSGRNLICEWARKGESPVIDHIRIWWYFADIQMQIMLTFLHIQEIR